ncbi:MAG TPA: FAD:protein FMN transferase [Acidimicrobiales bacterium]|jgi:thiamine biosynthesis lipoprotein|nr:FAD:protein FMN transferase [Acidimicrobiales bacterium]
MTTALALASRSFRAIGTTATVVVQHPAQAAAAEAILHRELVALDTACSRFRSDSELEHLHRHAGRPVVVSPLLFEALEVAVSVARMTHGAVDPTVGNAIAALGYDCDFEEIGIRPALPLGSVGPVAGYGRMELQAATRTVRIPRGVRLDLGSSAKAFAADRAARHIADQLGDGVLVSLGGDVAVAGPPPDGGWPVGIAHASSAPAPDVDQVVAITHGGLASSSPTVRTWTVGTEKVHHIVDPATGRPTTPYWTLVSASAASCIEANALSTAAIVWGHQALTRLRPYDGALRLVRHDGEVFTVGGWPGTGAP